MDVALAVIVVVAVVKAWALAATARWLVSAGEAYRIVLDSVGDDSATDYDLLALETGGGFLPTGFDDVLFRQLCKSLSGRPGLTGAVGRLMSRFQTSVFTLRWLALIGGATVVLTTVAADRDWPVFVGGRTVAAWGAYGLGLALFACVVLVAVVAITSFATLGTYGAPFYRRVIPTHTSGSDVLRELGVFVRVVVSVCLTAVAWVYVSAVRLHAFDGLVSRGGWGQLGRQFVSSIYFVTTTFSTTGYGDIAPAGVAGQVITIALEAASFVVVALLLALLFVAAARHDHLARLRNIP